MSDTRNAYTDAAESIVEHGQAMIRLGRQQLDDTAYAESIAGHVHAVRLVAAAHVDPTLDRGFFKELKAVAARSTGVFVLFEDGIAQLIVDSERMQHRFDLLSPAQIERRGYD